MIKKTTPKTDTSNDAGGTAAAAASTMGDPRPQFNSAAATAFAAIAQVRPDDLNRPTPCDDFDVATLLSHLITVLRRPRALALGENPFAQPDADTDTPAEAWADLFAAELAETQAAWADGSLLNTLMELPWAQVPGGAMLSTYTAELVVHTWDLAQAIGFQPEWTPSVVEVSLAASANLLPDGPREGLTLPNGMAIPFATAVTVADDAPPIDRLVAWYGRQPA